MTHLLTLRDCHPVEEMARVRVRRVWRERWQKLRWRYKGEPQLRTWVQEGFLEEGAPGQEAGRGGNPIEGEGRPEPVCRDGEAG